MKLYNFLLLFSFCFLTLNSFSQNENSKVFAESYQFEYNKDYTKSIAVLDEIYSSNSYEINLRLGWLHYSNEDYIKSLTYYQNAMHLKPNSIEAKLGYVYPAAAIENWENVIKTYNNILAIAPKNYTANSKLAAIYYYRKDFNTANIFSKKAYDLYPFNFEINLLCGKINTSLGNINEAKKYLNTALLYNPSSKEVITLLTSL